MMVRLPTGIEMLDRLLSGGIPRGAWVLVMGKPGSGKSTLTRLFMATGAILGETSVLVTTKETVSEVMDSMRLMGLSQEFLERIKFLEFVSPSGLSPDTLTGMSVEVGRTMEPLQLGGSPRLVIDSVSDALLFTPPEATLRFLQNLKSKLAAKEVTTLLVLEEGVHDERTTSLIEYFCDGTIRTRLGRAGRYFMVSRMRWTSCELIWLKLYNRIKVPREADQPGL